MGSILLDASRIGAANAGARVIHLPSEQKQVEDALKILAPAERKRKQCKKDIGSALDEIWFVANAPTKKKPIEIALKDLSKALRRCRNKYRALSKAEKVLINNKIYEEDFIDDFLTRGIEVFEKQLEEQKQQPKKPPRRSAYKQEAAVEAARSLIIKYRREQDRKHDLAKTRRSKWHQLSKILAGDQKDLFRHLLKVKAV